MWNQSQVDALLGKLTAEENLELFQLLWDNYLTEEQKSEWWARRTGEQVA